MRKHPSLLSVPGITHTAAGIPGDPLNVVLIGTEFEVTRAMLASGWYAADQSAARSCLGLIGATVLRSSCFICPVTNLYLNGRKQDIAFDQPARNSLGKSHHVRFWAATPSDSDDRPMWVGAAALDVRVGLTHHQVTYHVDADVDAERDYLLQTLKESNALTESYRIEHYHGVLTGKSGCGDPWHTDGALLAGVIRESHLSNPPHIHTGSGTRAMKASKKA